MKKLIILLLSLSVSASLIADDKVVYSSDPSKGSGIGYPSVAEAMSALKQKK